MSFCGRVGTLEIPEPSPSFGNMAETLHVVCAHCDAVNRVAAARLREAPVCGNCHQRLFSGQTRELSQANFQRFIERNDLPVVVDFWAPWCQPCLAMAPEYAAAAGELEPEARLTKVNTEANPNLANEFRIRSIPTLALFKAGSEVARQSGALTKADIVRWVRSHA